MLGMHACHTAIAEGKLLGGKDKDEDDEEEEEEEEGSDYDYDSDETGELMSGRYCCHPLDFLLLPLCVANVVP